MERVPSFNYNIYNVGNGVSYLNFENFEGIKVRLNYASLGNPTTIEIIKELKTGNGFFYKATKFDETTFEINPASIITLTPVKVVRGTYEYTDNKGVHKRVYNYFCLEMNEDYCYKNEKGNNILDIFERESFIL